MFKEIKTAWAMCQKYQIDTFLLMLLLSTTWWTLLEKDAWDSIGESFALGVYVSTLIAVNSYFINNLYLKKYLYTNQYGRFILFSLATIIFVSTVLRLCHLWYVRGLH